MPKNTRRYFEMCTCGEHGNLTCDHGDVVECYSRSAARELVKTLEEEGAITKAIAKTVQKEIEEAPLPEGAEEDLVFVSAEEIAQMEEEVPEEEDEEDEQDDIAEPERPPTLN